MSQELIPNKFELDQIAAQEQEYRLGLSQSLFANLKDKYGEDEVYSLITRECDVSLEPVRNWLFHRGGISTGISKRIYKLLQEVSKTPRPTDFPKGPLPKLEVNPGARQKAVRKKSHPQ